jgi:hypothetical protein
MIESDLSTPRKGIHASRIPILDIAAVDTVGTIAIAYGVSKYMNWSFLATTVGLFGLGEAFHHAYNIKTPIHDKLMQLMGITMDSQTPAPTQISRSCPMEHVWNTKMFPK